MNSKFYLFLIGCIGTRLLIAALAWFIGKNKNTSWLLPYLGLLALVPAFGFISIFLGNLRKRGFEAGGRIWWNDMRPIHGVMYILFAIYAFKNKKFAWKVLLVDVFIGLAAWFNHYY